MTGRLLIIQETATCPAATLLHASNPAHGFLAVSAAPEQATYLGLLEDLLEATGCEEFPRTPTATVERVTRARLIARDIETIAIVNADWLPDPILTQIWDLVRGLDRTLLLQPSDCGDDRVWGFAARRRAGTVDEEALASLLHPRTDTQVASIVEPVTQPTIDDIPDSGLLRFRHDARTLLPDDEFARFDEYYRSAYNAAGIIGWTPDEVGLLLAGLWGWCATPSEAIITARAVQAAALADGYLLDLDMDDIRHHITCHAHLALTAGHFQRLWAAFDPLTAYVVAAYDAGHSLAHIERMTHADVRAAHDGTLAGRRVHPAARPFLRVLDLAYENTGPDDPVLHNARVIRDTLVYAAYTYRLPLQIPPLRAGGNSHHNAYRGAITLRAIA